MALPTELLSNFGETNTFRTMKKAFTLLLLLILSAPSLPAKEVQFSVGASRMPVWEEKDICSRIVGHLKEGTVLNGEESEDGVWVRISRGKLEGWSLVRGFIFPWTPDIDIENMDFFVQGMIYDNNGSKAEIAYYATKKGVAYDLSKYKDLSRGESSGRADGDGDAEDGGDTVKGGGVALPPGVDSEDLFRWIVTALLALCALRAFRARRTSPNATDALLLLVTGAMEIAYVAVAGKYTYWFITIAPEWYVKAIYVVLGLALLYGQFFLFRALNGDRIRRRIIDGDEDGNYSIWAIGALAIGLGGFDFHYIFSWIGAIGVPLLYIFVARHMLSDGRSFGHGFIFVVTGLGLSCLSSGAFVVALTIVLGLFLLNLLFGNGSDLGRCANCFWYKHFVNERTTGYCYPDRGHAPNPNERLCDVADRAQHPVGGNGCVHFRSY